MEEKNMNDENMDDNQMQDENTKRDLADEIRKASGSLEVPERLKPEHLDGLLKQGKTQRNRFRNFAENMSDFVFRFRRPITAVSACAVLAVLVLFLTPFIRDGRLTGRMGKEDVVVCESGSESSAGADEADSGSADGAKEDAKTEDKTKTADEEAETDKAGMADEAAAAEEAGTADEEAKADKAETKVEGLIAAASYDDIYQQIYVESQKAWEKQQNQYYGSSAGVLRDSDAKAETEAAVAGDSAGQGAGGGHSETNVRTEGVDEGDVVKTDGEYIYSLSHTGTLMIVKADGGELSLVNKLSLESMEESAAEMFVDGNTLCIITTGYESGLKNRGDSSYSVENKEFTRLYTYDISQKSEGKAQLKGTVKQDGAYISSRKSGRYLYLFTNYTSVSEQPVPIEEYDDFVPAVNGERLAPDNMLYPECTQTDTQQLVISSVNLDKPENAGESISLLGVAGQFYVSTDNIFVYSEDYTGDDFRTQLVRFSYKDGDIRAEASGMVKGTLNNSFSLDEYDGHLRLVTTSYSDGSEFNGLYVLDKNLKVTGKADDIAKGETIRSARFMDNVGYFVTYKQTDPLFTADLSDPENPEIIGELKITGFSEYLHFYGEGKLLGIGWETDPDSGMEEGLKISMFDISDPREVKELHKTVLENVGYAPALNEYKTVLIDPDKNIFGFGLGSYGTNYQLVGNYGVFSYDDKEGFTQHLFQSLRKWSGTQDAYMEIERIRGVYIGSTFYLCGSGGIVAYDMEDSYRQTGTLDW